MKKRIVLVSSGQPSANPRLVKEAILLSQSGYDVTVIYCPLSPWADDFDTVLMNSYPQIKWIAAGSHSGKNRAGYLYARLRQKWYHTLFKIGFRGAGVAAKSKVLFSQELEKEAASINAHFYIGHNLGSLPAVVKAASVNGGKASFDFEDYHRGESDANELETEKTVNIENRYVPLLSFATAASPLICETYSNLFPAVQFLTINNCFPKGYIENEIQDLHESTLKLFWFSQTVGKNRGLETIIEAMGKVQSPVVFTLLGNCSQEMKIYLLNLAQQSNVTAEQLRFVNPVAEKEIVSIGAMHHIGMASEVPHILNRELCLTNKIFIYLLSGNAIVASSTQAQKKFLNEHEGIGMTYPCNDSDALAAILNHYTSNRELLSNHRSASLRLGMERFNWETEGTYLLQQLEKVIQ